MLDARSSERVRTRIRESVRAASRGPANSVDDDTDLIASGILSSLQMILLVAELEDLLGYEFAFRARTLADFSSIRAILALACEALGASEGRTGERAQGSEGEGGSRWPAW